MADNRINQALENIANGEPFDNPRTDDEVMLSKIAAGEEITENARNRFQYWLKQIEVGGGNPNYVETIQGTLANPWGSISPATLKEELTFFNASAELIIDARALVQDSVYLQASYRSPQDILWFYSVGTISETNTSAVGVTYEATGAFMNAMALNAGQFMNISPYASSLPTVLRIIHHPLPNGG